jgi:hypothetical protein
MTTARLELGDECLRGYPHRMPSAHVRSATDQRKVGVGVSKQRSDAQAEDRR